MHKLQKSHVLVLALPYCFAVSYRTVISLNAIFKIGFRNQWFYFAQEKKQWLMCFRDSWNNNVLNSGMSSNARKGKTSFPRLAVTLEHKHKNLFLCSVLVSTALISNQSKSRVYNWNNLNSITSYPRKNLQ